MPVFETSIVLLSSALVGEALRPVRPDTEVPVIQTAPSLLQAPMAYTPPTHDTTRWPGQTAKVLTMICPPSVQVATSEFDRAAAALDSYLLLGPGWDGEGSEVPTATAVARAKAFLRSLPFGVPPPKPMVSRNGAAELYWNLETGYVDVSFDRDGVVSVFAENPEGRDFFIDNVEPNFTTLPRQRDLMALLAPKQLQFAA